MRVGCRMGRVNIPVARIPVDRGRVVTVDLQQEMLDMLRRQAEKAGVADEIQVHKCERDHLGVDVQVDFALGFAQIHGSLGSPSRLHRPPCWNTNKPHAITRNCQDP